MATTQLSLIAIPGRRYSFSPKAEAPSGEKGLGPFTELSVIAIPGGRHSFSAKTPAEGGEKGEGPFTALSVMALPGRRHSFEAKAPYIPDEGGSKPFHPWKEQYDKLDFIRRDDEEIAYIMHHILSWLN